MIKVEVTQLKAPWPAGAVVGSVVLLAVPLLPAWAVGKCTVVTGDDEREPVGTWEPPAPAAEPTLVVNPSSAADQLAEQAVRVAELGQQLQDAEQALGTARAEIQSLGAQLAEVHAELERAKAATATVEAAAARAEADLLDAIAERDTAKADAQALREGLPAIIGDGTGEALPPVAEVKAPAVAAKTAKRANAA